MNNGKFIITWHPIKVIRAHCIGKKNSIIRNKLEINADVNKMIEAID